MADTSQPLKPGQNLIIQFHLFKDAIVSEWWWNPPWITAVALLPYPMGHRLVTPFN